MEKKIWAKTVLQAYNYIGRICRVIDKQVLERSAMSHLNSYGYDDTIAITESVIDLIERKKALLILKFMVEDSVQFLDDNLRKVLVLFYFDRRTVAEISTMIKVSPRTVNRILDKAILKCFMQFEKNGFNIDSLKKYILTEPWLVGIYNSIVEKSRRPDLKISSSSKKKINLYSINTIYSSSVKNYLYR